MIKLSKRLGTVASYISDNVKLVDIGCDHGLLDIYLAKNRKNITIIASDINENALNNAISNIKKYKLEDIIDYRVSNGLNNINKDEIDTIVISGMGAHTIVGILYTNMRKLKYVKNIIIQSNNNIDFLRYKVTKLGYYIRDEKLVKDAGIIYTVIYFAKGRKYYSKKKLYFGPILLNNRDDLFKEKYTSELEKLKILYKLIPRNHYHHRFKTYMKIKMYKSINL